MASLVKHSLDLADRVAATRGINLTDTRREVLALVLQSDHPIGAYQVLENLQQSRGRVLPPTVYRALNFLIEQGFVHRIESLNAFVACTDLAHTHMSQFVICNHCGKTQELFDETIAQSLTQRAAGLGFEVLQQTIELRGLCTSCRQKSA